MTAGRGPRRIRAKRLARAQSDNLHIELRPHVRLDGRLGIEAWAEPQYH
eukprot:CAMPEP_0184395276 /NCGR_PEP_ID=MMETSP0007-20130409/43544_1 /TAXON_ID=97485 /ORGANISM="Prymnesium parvum, Strain Texoma1" /LENGTH=48 /DNA_ID= /DNA_START= /DNA_END= /DNA_ORIENTATION=